MKNRALLFVVTAALLMLAGNAEAAPKPNLLIILADDLGYADLSCQGSKDIPTPNIDSIAKRGVHCSNGYVTSNSYSYFESPNISYHFFPKS
jgi:hypothetical protein